MTILNTVRKELLDKGITEENLHLQEKTHKSVEILNDTFEKMVFKFGALADSKLK
jgi:hypothetical protein